MEKNQKKVVTIEARMTSSRLPGKVLMKCCEKPMLQLMIERIRKSSQIDDIIVATTINEADNQIYNLCQEINCKCYRGSEDDVLERVLEAAQSLKADVIVETTGDCPLIDWNHIDYLLDIYIKNDYDYVANNIEKSFPDGFDIRIFSTKLLKEANVLTQEQSDHEHVSIYFPKHPEKYKLFNWKAEGIFYKPDLAVTLDEFGDYQLIKTIYESLYLLNNNFTCKDIIGYLTVHPELLKFNDNIIRTVVD